MVAEQHGLRLLHVRVARHDDAELALACVEQGLAQAEHALHELCGEFLAVVARVGRHLVVAAASRVQSPAGCANVLCESALNGHVYVFVCDIELEGACCDSFCNRIQAGAYRPYVLICDDALLAEHVRMGLGTFYVRFPHAPVDWQGRAEALCELLRAVFEAPAPQRVAFAFVLFHCNAAFPRNILRLYAAAPRIGTRPTQGAAVSCF